MVRENDRAIVVLTADTVETILARNGSGDWVFNPDKVNDCKYLVCCRTRNWRNRKEHIEDRAAFLLGVIADLRVQPDTANSRGQLRYLIEISDYALINIPDAWAKGARNPIAYRTLKDLGIDLRSVKLEPVPKNPASQPHETGNKRMSIAEAKQALAESFGVRPEDVEITIRG